MAFWNKDYSLNKSRQVFSHTNTWYRKHWKRLDSGPLKRLEHLLAELDAALQAQDKPRASQLAHEVQIFSKAHCRKSVPLYLLEVIIAIAVALSVATVMRQMWFEPMKIPSGFMRPTFREQDHLVVFKTAFALNVPLRTEHFIFEPENVIRGGVIIWTGDNIDLPDTDTTYFLLFPERNATSNDSWVNQATPSTSMAEKSMAWTRMAMILPQNSAPPIFNG